MRTGFLRGERRSREKMVGLHMVVVAAVVCARARVRVRVCVMVEVWCVDGCGRVSSW